MTMDDESMQTENGRSLKDHRFGDVRDEIRMRAEGARLEVAVVEWPGVDDDDTDPYYLEVSVPNGREKRHFALGARRAVEFAKSRFEYVTFIGDYIAIYDRESGVLEAQINHQGGSLLASKLARVPGVEYFDDVASAWRSVAQDEDGREVGQRERRSRISRSSWRLALNDPSAPFELEMSILTDSFRALLGERDLPIARRSGTSLKIKGVAETRHDAVLGLLESNSSAFFFELDVRFDLILSLSRQRRITSISYNSADLGSSVQPVRLPRQKYSKEAVTLYSYGRAALGTPLLQYLAYYQAIEYFFPSFVNAKVLSRVRNELRDPTFNSEDDAHLQRLVSLATAGQRGGSVLEKEQLRATIESCVDEQQLRKLFQEVGGMAEFLADKSHIKSVGTISLSEKADVLAQVVERVYQLRCRIVHSKSDGGPNEAKVLLPFSSESRRLDYDLVLIRYLCQKVIICGSRGTLW